MNHITLQDIKSNYKLGRSKKDKVSKPDWSYKANNKIGGTNTKQTLVSLKSDVIGVLRFIRAGTNSDTNETCLESLRSMIINPSIRVTHIKRVSPSVVMGYYKNTNGVSTRVTKVCEGVWNV